MVSPPVFAFVIKTKIQPKRGQDFKINIRTAHLWGAAMVPRQHNQYKPQILHPNGKTRVVPFIYHSASLMEGQVPTADECRRALFNHTGSPTAKPVGKIGMLAVPYKLNLKPLPYQLTPNPKTCTRRERPRVVPL